MDIFNFISFIGGISLFLFGMNVMSKSLEKSAGGKLNNIVSKMTSNPFLGLLTGAGVTAIIQSSSATTVMVVGFVNSGIMNLSQAIGVIMGANIGTTITSWILSLSGISGDTLFLSLLKPTSFSPILAFIGIILFMFCKSNKKKDIGLILLGFATLMFGMHTMSESVSVLKNAIWFRNLFVAFENNPLLGVLMGILVTAIIQSSSASIGILQAFALTGQISLGAAIPIILGQNIGTCVTAILSSIGTNKNAKRASLVHLLFNVIGTIIALIGYLIVFLAIKPAFLSEAASLMDIAIVHTGFNISCTILLFPFSKWIEVLVCKLIPSKDSIATSEIDERLLSTPTIALEQVKSKILEMANETETAFLSASCIVSGKLDYGIIQQAENATDHYEDLIGTYLVKLSSKEMDESNSKTANLYLKIIGDLERIADHALNIGKTSKEMQLKDVSLSEHAILEINSCFSAVNEIWTYTKKALTTNDFEDLEKIEPLEQVVDIMVKKVRDNHIRRIQNDECKIDKGFILADLLSNIERISDHCSNIAGYILDGKKNNLNSHENVLLYREKEQFKELFLDFQKKYLESI